MLTRQTAAVLWLGSCFFVLFSGYSVFKSLLPSVRNDAGPVFVAVGYIAYALGSLLKPQFIVTQLRVCFIVAMMSYPLYIFSVQASIDALTIIASVYNGFAAGLLWSAQGCWMSAICAVDKKNAATYNGTFMMLYGIAGVIGNMFVAITDYEVRIIIWILGCTSVCGLVMTALTPHKYLYICDIQSLPHIAITRSASGVYSISNSSHDDNDTIPCSDIDGYDTAKSDFESDSDNESGIVIVAAQLRPNILLTRIRGIAGLIKFSKFYLMIIPIFSLSAISVYIWVVIPTKLTSRETAICLAVFNLVYGIMSRVTSIVIKYIGMISLYTLTTIFTLATYVILGCHIGLDLISIQTTAYVCAVTCGVAIGFNSVIASTVYSEFEPTWSLEAYCIHNVIYCLLYAALSVMLTRSADTTISIAAIVVICWISVLSLWCMLVYTAKRECCQCTN